VFGVSVLMFGFCQFVCDLKFVICNFSFSFELSTREHSKIRNPTRRR